MDVVLCKDKGTYLPTSPITNKRKGNLWSTGASMHMSRLSKVSVKSDITWTKELTEIRQMVEFLVRRERKLDVKTDVAVRRLERLERDQDEQDDHDREANLEEALVDKTKVVKLVVDKWFVDRGFGFGKVPTGEIVFIHASAVVGAEVLTIGTDAWVQVVNDDARAQGVSSWTSLGTRRVEGREGQRESEQGGPTSEASGGSDCRTCSSVREEDSCGVRPAAGA